MTPRGGPRGSNLDADIRRLGLTQEQRTSLVAFLKALTDDRVRCERAPFDHPEITLPRGHPSAGGALVDSDGDGRADDLQLVLPAVGAGGLTASGLPCVGGFLGAPAGSLRINFQPATAAARPGYWRGLLGEIRIHRRALSPAEIQTAMGRPVP